jgi:hypothetical protein
MSKTIQLTRNFPKKDGIYILEFRSDEPQLVNVETDEYPLLNINPIPCYSHSDCFCLDKNMHSKEAKWFGPITFVKGK